LTGLTCALSYAGLSLDTARWNLVPVIILCLMGALGAAVRAPDVGPDVGLSFTSIIVVSAVALGGPAGAAVVGFVAYLLDFRRQPLQARLFNSTMIGATGAVSGMVYLLTGGVDALAKVSGPTDLLLHMGLPLMVADVALAITNAFILGGVVRITEGVPVRVSASRMLSVSGVAYIGYGIIGFLLVVLWGSGNVGPFSAVLVLAPLFVTRWVYMQYGDEQRAHKRTIASLIAAAEVNDVYTGGHSQRVASLCALMARARSMGHQRSDALRFAAVLHDVGMIGVPATAMRHEGPLTLADLREIQRHPILGVEMVSEIDFLQESFGGIRHHHERFDGRGYPEGLAGEQIPEFARIIAVADAFDSMTTARTYRPAMSVEEALAELRARAGTQLDPEIVSALEQALGSHSWEPTPIDDAALARAGSAHDHDDPAISDLMAGHREQLQVSTSLLTGRRVVEPGSESAGSVDGHRAPA
jgi:hypothetical protein